MTVLTIPSPSAENERAAVRGRIEIALDLAMLVLRNGGSTWMADRTFRNVAKGYGREGATAAWRLDFAAAHCMTSSGALTVVRSVGNTRVNLVRVSEAAMLSEKVARGEVDPVKLRSEIERISILVMPYNRLLMMIAAALGAAAFCRIGGGDWTAAGAALVAASVGQAARSQLVNTTLPPGAIVLTCGVISAWCAALFIRIGMSHVGAPTLLASVVYLVPGLPLINGFMDAMGDKFLIVGLERIIRAVVLFVVLAIAIASAVAVLL